MEICSDFLLELADGDPGRLGVDSHGGCLVLETITDVFDGGDGELETHSSCFLLLRCRKRTDTLLSEAD